MDARRSGPRFSASGLVLAALVAASAGCFSDPTEVVVVVDTDAVSFVDFQQIKYQLGFSPNLGGTSAVGNPEPMPSTLGLTPSSPGATTGATTFDVVVTFAGNMGQPFLQRKVSNIRFVPDQVRALFIPILKACACNGTNCPHALDDGCRDITAPVLTSFDENNLPRVGSQ
ncbi:MAG TPA: hypothetical protein VG319_14920 [Polyangia bacterium]|jgi:hypothetical protein|nr:hypothetical protein [Polyangia bacterium]